jgi:hypothetical protein
MADRLACASFIKLNSMDKLISKGDAFMNSKKNNKNSPVSDSVSTKSVMPSTQPVPKKENEIRAAKNGSTKDSDPTM